MMTLKFDYDAEILWASFTKIILQLGIDRGLGRGWISLLPQSGPDQGAVINIDQGRGWI